MTVYFLLRKSDGLLKVGYTDNFPARLTAIKAEFGDCDVLGVMDGDRNVERSLHLRFEAYRRDAREWYADVQEIRQFIKDNTSLNIPPRKKTEERVIKVRREVHKAVLLLAAEAQMQTGETTTLSEGLWTFIQMHRPDIATRCEQDSQS